MPAANTLRYALASRARGESGPVYLIPKGHRSARDIEIHPDEFEHAFVGHPCREPCHQAIVIDAENLSRSTTTL
jgi:hypothetical protein